MTLSDDTVKETAETTTYDTDVVKSETKKTAKPEKIVDYKIEDLVTQFEVNSMAGDTPNLGAWKTKVAQDLKEELGTTTGLYMWILKEHLDTINTNWAPNKIFNENYLALVEKAHYIGTGDLILRGFNGKDGKHGFASYLAAGDDIHGGVTKADFEFFYFAIEDKLVYEFLEALCFAHNKNKREDGKKFEVEDWSKNAGSVGQKLRGFIKWVRSGKMTMEDHATLANELAGARELLFADPKYRTKVLTQEKLNN